MNIVSGSKQYVTVFLLCVIGTFSYVGYRNFLLQQEKGTLEEALSNEQSEHASTTMALYISNKNLIQTKQERDELAQEVSNQRIQVGFLTDQVSSITGTVNVLDKLRKTDPELLKKYSKIYFLNENYVPARLAEIDRNFVYDPGVTGKWINTDVLPFLQNLLNAGAGQGIDLQIISAYRSFGMQSDLKSSYSVTYGAGTANQFSADQGYSEHQLGTTIDFTTKKLGIGFSSFANTDTYKWLLENAYRYGFTLSYPKNNTYYRFEPWHWRFVGIKLATKLHDENKNFYDLEQREINNYLVSIFDPQ